MEKEELLKEIARAFGWFKKKRNYDYDTPDEPITPNEAMVLVHLGKLLERQKHSDDSVRLDGLDRRVFDIETKTQTDI